MRLLQYTRTSSSSSTYTFSLIKCDPRHTLQYAILSHRWSADNDDEVTLRDIERDTAKQKAGGYKKLEFCARQAERDGLMYFWVDTCCIDKTSSAELSAAITSMYKWYRNAAKCYVYLPDVLAGQEWEAAFQRSEWFKRGWTLQELLAPKVVEFFSCGGSFLGTKDTLKQEVHQITDIPLAALQGTCLSHFPVDERFRWSKNRDTQLEEDQVYCLVGIFDVSIPVIYGEGQARARERLQREIGGKLFTFPESLSV